LERRAFLFSDAQLLPAGFPWLATAGADADGKVAAVDADANTSAAQSAAPTAKKQDLAIRPICRSSAINR
jgi:hypothetical protein